MYTNKRDFLIYITKKFPRKPTAFRRGMNWENYFFYYFNNFFNSLQYLLLYITINFVGASTNWQAMVRPSSHLVSRQLRLSQESHYFSGGSMSITEKAEEHGWVIENMEVMPDHVHSFVKADPTSSVAYIVAQFKGYTSHAIRKKYPELWSRLPSLWSRSYFAASVGHISEETVKKYINDQKYKGNLLSSHE